MLFLEMFRKALNHLTNLGLKDNEAEVYLSCCQKPAGLFVHEIVEKTELKRSTIDLILQRLRKNGFVSRHKEGARWVYCAEHPEKIGFSFEEKLKDYQSFIPFLLQNMQGKTTPVVHFYEGVKGIGFVFDDILLTLKRQPPSHNELLVASSGLEVAKLLPDHSKQFIKKRIKHGIPIKILAPDQMISQKIYASSPQALRETRFFDSTLYPFNIEMDIYADKLALFDLNTDTPNATIIESQRITSSMRSLFKMLWISSV